MIQTVPGMLVKTSEVPRNLLLCRRSIMLRHDFKVCKCKTKDPRKQKSGKIVSGPRSTGTCGETQIIISTTKTGQNRLLYLYK